MGRCEAWEQEGGAGGSQAGVAGGGGGCDGCEAKRSCGGVPGTEKVISEGENDRQVSTPKFSKVIFRSDGGGILQADHAVRGGDIVDEKVGIAVEGVAKKWLVWGMCRWKLSVQWKTYMVKKAVKWIRHGEGFVLYDNPTFDPMTWSVDAHDFEEGIQNVEDFQEERGLWCDWLVYRVAGLLKRCGTVKAFQCHYMGRRFVW